MSAPHPPGCHCVVCWRARFGADGTAMLTTTLTEAQMIWLRARSKESARSIGRVVREALMDQGAPMSCEE